MGLAPKGLIPSDLRHITSTKALRIGAKWSAIVSGSAFWGAPYLVGLSYNYYYVNQEFPRDANQLWHRELRHPPPPSHQLTRAMCLAFRGLANRLGGG